MYKSVILLILILTSTTLAGSDTELKSPSSTGNNYSQWSSPANVYSSNNQHAVETRNNEKQDWYNFNFSIPENSTIDGIEVVFEAQDAYCDDGNGAIVELSWDGGVSYTSSGYSFIGGCATDIIITLGNSSDTWGRTWTSSEFSNANFNIRLSKIGYDYDPIWVDFIQVRVHYTTEAITEAITIDGDFTDWDGFSVYKSDALNDDNGTGWDIDKLYITDDVNNVYFRVTFNNTSVGDYDLYLQMSVDPLTEPGTITGHSGGGSWDSGYDFQIQSRTVERSRRHLSESESPAVYDWNWETLAATGEQAWTTVGNYSEIEMSFPKSALDNPNILGWVQGQLTEISVIVYATNSSGDIREELASGTNHGGILYEFYDPLQCSIEETTTMSDLDRIYDNMGQSFIACQTGVLNSIGVLGYGNQTGLEMKVYDGEGLGGTLLGTFSNLSVQDATDEYDFTEIDVSSEVIVVTSGSVYTFYFSPIKIDTYYSDKILYTDGVSYKSASADGGKDMAFKIIIEEELLPVELATFTAFFVNNNVELNWATETEVNNIGFDIERKYQDEIQSWKTIGFVKGYGHSNSPKYYSFVDENTNINCNCSYRLKQIDNDGSYEYSQIIELVQSVPSNFSLSQNYPNPFNPTTNISFSIPNAGIIELRVYDILGSEVAEIVNDKLEAGNYNYKFNASSLSNGVYFYSLRTSDFVATKKMLLLK